MMSAPWSAVVQVTLFADAVPLGWIVMVPMTLLVPPLTLVRTVCPDATVGTVVDRIQAMVTAIDFAVAAGVADKVRTPAAALDTARVDAPTGVVAEAKKLTDSPTTFGFDRPVGVDAAVLAAPDGRVVATTDTVPVGGDLSCHSSADRFVCDVDPVETAAAPIFVIATPLTVTDVVTGTSAWPDRPGTFSERPTMMRFADGARVCVHVRLPVDEEFAPYAASCVNAVGAAGVVAVASLLTAESPPPVLVAARV